MKFSNIKKGEVLSSTMYLTVQEKVADGIVVKDGNGKEFTVKGKKLIESTMNSNQQYDKSEKVSQTAAAELLTSAGDSVFTVEFEKLNGETRRLVGRLLNTENQLGRSNVIDLEITQGTPQRQVDHRTIKRLVLRGTEYLVK